MVIKKSVFVVDDDDAVRESLAALLESHGLDTIAFASALDFLATVDRNCPGCLIADIRMPDMDGLELQERVAAHYPNIAVVIITGHGDVPLAVRAMRAGAVDFLEKPFSGDRVVATVSAALDQSEQQRRAASSVAEAAARIALLTPREREVLSGLVAGLPNKSIGYDLGISPRTVEIHRARVMEKLQAKSLSDLIRLALTAGVSPT